MPNFAPLRRGPASLTGWSRSSATPPVVDEFALVRLTVDGDRIVDADAPGLARPLAGLTLIEAAAVPARRSPRTRSRTRSAQVFVAEPRPGRAAVAMSGGVDSAVALLRAAPNAIGVTLRLWLDPDGPDTERACCSPEAVIAARETCHALGLPHVTLDLREDFRSRRRRAVRGRYARGETPNPCIALQRHLSLRRTARVRPAGRRRPARHRPLRPHRRAPRPPTARARRRPAKDQSYMLARSTRRCSTGSGSRSASRTRRRRAPRPPQPGSPSPSAARARRRASSPAATTATSSSGTALDPPTGASSTRTGASSAGTRASGASRPVSAAVSGRRRPAALRARRATPPRTPSSSARARRSPCTSSPPRVASTSTVRADAKLRYRSPAVAARVEPTSDGFRLRLDEPAYAVARARSRPSTRATPSSERDDHLASTRIGPG